MQLVVGDVGQGVALADAAEEVRVGDVGVEFAVDVGVGEAHRQAERLVWKQLRTDAQLQAEHRGRIAVEGVADDAVHAGGSGAFAQQIVVVAQEPGGFAAEPLVREAQPGLVVQGGFLVHTRGVARRREALVDAAEKGQTLVEDIDCTHAGQPHLSLVAAAAAEVVLRTGGGIRGAPWADLPTGSPLVDALEADSRSEPPIAPENFVDQEERPGFGLLQTVAGVAEQPRIVQPQGTADLAVGAVALQAVLLVFVVAGA